MREQLPGGWSRWDFAIPPEIEVLFEFAMEDLIGVEYAPIAFAQRSTAHCNYAFIAVGSPVVNNPQRFLALIYLSRLQQGASIEGIKRVSLSEMGGGYSAWSFPAREPVHEMLEQVKMPDGKRVAKAWGSAQKFDQGDFAAVFVELRNEAETTEIEAAVAILYRGEEMESTLELRDLRFLEA